MSNPLKWETEGDWGHHFAGSYEIAVGGARSSLFVHDGDPHTSLSYERLMTVDATHDGSHIERLKMAAEAHRQGHGNIDTLTPEQKANVEQALVETRLHDLARAFMQTRPDLTPYSLDEWMIEHNEKLSPNERATGHAILELCHEKGLV